MGSRTPAEFQQDGPTLNQQNSNADISGPISQPNFVFETPPFAPILHNVQYIQVEFQLILFLTLLSTGKPVTVFIAKQPKF